MLLDNARIHHSAEIIELVQNHGPYDSWAHRQSHHSYTHHVYFPGCIIEYLPPYSPDYQPVEEAFSVIKSYLKRIGLSFYTPGAHYFELYEACEKITPEMTWGFFRHTGYI